MARVAAAPNFSPLKFHLAPHRHSPSAGQRSHFYAPDLRGTTRCRRICGERRDAAGSAGNEDDAVGSARSRPWRALRTSTSLLVLDSGWGRAARGPRLVRPSTAPGSLSQAAPASGASEQREDVACVWNAGGRRLRLGASISSSTSWPVQTSMAHADKGQPDGHHRTTPTSFRQIPMDYDDTDFQSQNFQIAGEDNSKSPSGLRPLALPKLDIDDQIQGHLRFDNITDSEGFSV